MDAGQIVTIVTSILGGSLGTALLTQMTQKAKDRRQEDRAAWVERDREAGARRILEEYAHKLRRLLFALGVVEGPGPKEVPFWPKYKSGESNES